MMTGSWPADASTGSGALTSITLSFSEAVDRVSVLEQLRIEPPRVVRGVRWQADTLLVLTFWDPLPADTTFAVYLLPGWTDRHKVAQSEWQILSFATGDSLLPGWLGGKVTFRGSANPAMHLELSDSTGAIHGVIRPDRKGEFYIRQLHVDGRPLSLVAWQDADGDSLYDPAFDFADTLSDSTLILTRAQGRALKLTMNVIDPNEPGELSGGFSDSDSLIANYQLRLYPDSLRFEGDSLAAGNAALLPDSLLDSLLVAGEAPSLWLREAGQFKYDGLAPGAWWLLLFKDQVPDSVWSPGEEPAHFEAGPLWLTPGGTISAPRFEIQVPDTSAAETDSTNAAAVDSTKAAAADSSSAASAESTGDDG